MKYTKIIIWAIIILGVVALVVWIVRASKVEPSVILEGVEELGTEFPVVSRSHIQPEAEHETYNSNPPTSGSHYANAPTAGFYKDGLEDEAAIHGLEHGYIWISYKNIDDTTLEKLKEIQKRNWGSVILSPREQNDAPIVLASWGRLLNMESLDEATINTYIKLYKNTSPEKLAK